MKHVLTLMVMVVVTVLLSGIALAEPFTVMLDDEPFPDAINVSPNTSISYSITIAKGILIKNYSITSDEGAYQNLIDKHTGPAHFKRLNTSFTEEGTFQVPKTLPQDSTTLSIEILYEDANMTKHQFSKDVTVQVQDGSGMLGFLVKILPDGVVSWAINSFF